MAQFDVFRNLNPATAAGIPFLFDVQSGLLYQNPGCANCQPEA